jgi:hypothetical protein
MESVRKLKILAGVYMGLLLLLLLCVSLMPLIVRHGIAVQRFVIEEETLETFLILALFGISYPLLRGLIGTLRSYRQAAEQALAENASLLSRLAETFQYVGTVNVEIQEMQSVLGGIDCYPQSRKEFQRCLERLAVKAMAIIGAPWVVIRIIDRQRGRTLKECAAQRRKGVLPLATLGNRDILENRPIENRAKVILQPKNIDLLAVCIFSAHPAGDVERLLLSAILNQCLMLFLLNRCGCFQPPAPPKTVEKEGVP